MLNDPLDSGRFTRKQLDRKYKHAADFDITDTKKNSETLTKFRDGIKTPLADKNISIVKTIFLPLAFVPTQEQYASMLMGVIS